MKSSKNPIIEWHNLYSREEENEQTLELSVPYSMYLNIIPWLLLIIQIEG